MSENLLNSLYPELVSEEGKIITYTSLSKELELIGSGVGVRNVSDKNIIGLKGKDVLEFLNRIATQNVKELPVAGITNTLFTNEKGRIIDRTTLISLDNKFLLLSNCSCDTRVKNWIEKYIIMEDVNTELLKGQYLVLDFYGYQAESFLTLFCGEMINQVSEDKLILVTYEDVQFFIYKSPENTHIKKYVLFAANEYEEKIINYLHERKSVFDFSFIGEEAWEIFRIQNGIPKFPNELNDDFNPHEADLLCDVSFNKGCYIGQEVIARLGTYDKVQKYLTGVFMENPTDLNGDSAIYDEKGEEVGVITSLVKSPDQDFSIGMAYIRKAFLENSSDLYFKNRGENKKIELKEFPINL